MSAKGKPAIAVFVKTPGLSPVKTRLATKLGGDAAEAFYRLSVMAVRDVVESMAQAGKCAGFWAVAEEAGVGDALWNQGSMARLWTGDGNLGARQHRVYERLLVDYSRVFIIAADAPQISCAIFDKALSVLDEKTCVIGAAHDGGYYLFGGRKPIASAAWQGIAWGGDTVRDALMENLQKHVAPDGIDTSTLPVLTDIDEEENLNPAMDEMPQAPNPAQKAVMEWVRENKGG